MVMKKDFKAIAEIIKKQAITDNGDLFLRKVTKQIGRIYAPGLADYFAGQNPKFDRKRFMEACGL